MSTVEQRKNQRKYRERINKVWHDHDDGPDMFKVSAALFEIAGGHEAVAGELWLQYQSSPANSQFRERLLRMMLSSWQQATPKEADTHRVKRLTDAELDKEIERMAKIAAKVSLDELPEPEYVI